MVYFYRIEYRYLSNKADAVVYEAYYISKYKPQYNNDLIFDDELTLELPELEGRKKLEGYNFTSVVSFMEDELDIENEKVISSNTCL